MQVKKTVPIVTCFLFQAGKVLLLRRSPERKFYPGKWGAVSGYLEKGKSPLKQAISEIREEVGIDESDLELVNYNDPIDVYDAQKTICWKVYPFAFRLKNHMRVRLDWENEEFKWIDPKDFSAFDTVPGLDEVFAAVFVRLTE
ncbi:MAG: NUDIX pyrophosphatase [Deltaproteobacteria bacterium]|nr:MAG: NUDIX pyrophosphatase [Deltaproteobacteria bacterium]RLB08578.1 MAG: NUDIX pyrophosphatase [Deltaproteobacteria bacterium]